MEQKKKKAKLTRPSSKKEHRVSTVWFFLLAAFGGAACAYWLYWSWDYQDNSAPSYEGYHLTEQTFDSLIKKQFTSAEPVVKGVKVNERFAEGELALAARQRYLKAPAQLPFFKLTDVAEKQTTYTAIADLSSLKHVERVEFPVWGDPDGTNDLQIYQGSYEPATNTWRCEIPIKQHKEAGHYQVKIKVTRENGATEQTGFGEFMIEQPTITATVDGARAEKGQFDIIGKATTAADIENLSVPVWTKEDQSDTKAYRAKIKADGTYSVHVDYEDFDFTSGLYYGKAKLLSANGLTAEGEAGSVAIEVSRPVRMRLLHDATLFKDRTLAKAIRRLPANSMAYVKGIVYNDNQKIYRTTDGYISAENIDVNEMMEDIRTISHRGNHQVAPENTIPAFQQSNGWGVETDIRLTKDKHWVVMHDATVDRTTNGKGKVRNLTLEQIKKLRIDQGANKEKYTAEQLRVPTLEEYLSVIKTKQSVPFIEIKDEEIAAADYDRLAELIRAYDLADWAIIISFGYNNLVEMRKRLPEVHVQLLVRDLTDQLIDQVSTFGENAGLNINYASVAGRNDLIAKVQSKHLAVSLWGVPQSEFKKMEALGINNLTTDYE
jgi:glycerophosphoryl diester phosphodiesterase